MLRDIHLLRDLGQGAAGQMKLLRATLVYSSYVSGLQAADLRVSLSVDLGMTSFSADEQADRDGYCRGVLNIPAVSEMSTALDRGLYLRRQVWALIEGVGRARKGVSPVAELAGGRGCTCMCLVRSGRMASVVLLICLLPWTWSSSRRLATPRAAALAS